MSDEVDILQEEEHKKINSHITQRYNQYIQNKTNEENPSKNDMEKKFLTIKKDHLDFSKKLQRIIDNLEYNTTELKIAYSNENLGSAKVFNEEVTLDVDKLKQYYNKMNDDLYVKYTTIISILLNHYNI